MAKKKTIPQYTSVERKGIQYYRTRILDADGKQVSLYATTCEELYEKQLAARDAKCRKSSFTASIRPLRSIARNGW